jgi:hypothetical protein
MNAQSPVSASELTVCPSCGAAVANDAKSCWLCKWDLLEEIVTAEVVAEPPGYIQKSASAQIGLTVGFITLGLVTVGVFAAAPGIGVLLGIVFVIVAFAVAKGLRSDGPVSYDRSAIAQAYTSPSAVAAAKRGSVVAEVFKVLGIIALVGVAAIIAFFTFCALCMAVLYSQ